MRSPGWNRAWREAVDPGTTDEDADQDALRLALVDHLRRFRGIVAAPEQVLLHPRVTTATADLVARADLAERTVALEDPGYPSARDALRHRGARVRPVPVDDEGIVVHRLRPDDAAAYVTPAHQFPTGSALSLARRVALVQWAIEHDALVVEDDYDGEFRYDADPLPALATLRGGEDRVAYLGTSSKLLTPALRVAWAVLPPRLVTGVASVDLARSETSGFAVRALTHLLVHGEVSRHHARAMRTYAARRAALIRHLGALAPSVRVTGVSAGLHVLAWLPAGVDDRAVAEALSARGYRSVPLADYARRRVGPGLVIGYASLPETRARELVLALAGVLGGSARDSAGS